MSNEIESSENLIERYNNDILYDCHQTETKIQRSLAKRELQKRGKSVLKLIGNKIEILFPEGKEIDYDLFMAWISLIYDIIKDHHLPESPYNTDVKYGNQKVIQWINYCYING